MTKNLFFGIRKDNGKFVIGESFKKVDNRTFIGSGINWVEVNPLTVTTKDEESETDEKLQ